MNNIRITNFGEFQNVINSLEISVKKIHDIFASEVKNSKEIDGTDTWNGNAQKALHTKYVELMKNFPPIEYSLDLYVKFLKKTLEDYTRLVQELDRNTNEMANSLDVNS